MDLQIIRILTFIIIGVALLLWIITAQIFRFNKKKAFVTACLSLIFSLFVINYIHILYLSTPFNFRIKAPLSIQEQEELHKVDDIVVAFQFNGNTIEIADGDDIEINKKVKFKIVEVKGVKSEGEIKADFKGFAPTGKRNDNQDIGYWITYKDVLKRWQVEGFKDKYEVHILNDKEEQIGGVYVLFVD